MTINLSICSRLLHKLRVEPVRFRSGLVILKPLSAGTMAWQQNQGENTRDVYQYKQVKETTWFEVCPQRSCAVGCGACKHCARTNLPSTLKMVS